MANNQYKKLQAKGLSVSEIAAEMDWHRKKTYAALEGVPVAYIDGKTHRYALPELLYPLLEAVGVDAQKPPVTLSPLDQLNLVKSKREQLRLSEEMGILGKAEDWDEQAAMAMKNLSNSLDGLPDLLTERLQLGDDGFQLCQKIVDGFRTSLYNTLVLGGDTEEEDT